MCNGHIEQSEMFGSGKGAIGWFDVTQAQVYFDHPFQARLEEAVMIDFVNPALGPSARVAVELSKESALALVQMIQDAILHGEHAHDPITLEVAHAN